MRSLSLRWLALGIIAAGLLQTIAVGAIVWDRARILATGTEVVLETTFVDPRDLFRGHYTTLNLAVGRLAKDKIKVSGRLWPGKMVYVGLQKGEGAFWAANSLSTEPPPSDLPVLYGKLTSLPSSAGIGNDVYRVQFPFDRYFAPKLRAEELEKFRREERLGVILALDGEGGGVIKGVTVDGERIYDEPLW